MKKDTSSIPRKLPVPKDTSTKLDRILEDIHKVYKSIEEKWAITVVGASYCGVRISELLFPEMTFFFKLILHFVEIISALIFFIVVLTWIKRRFFAKPYTYE